MQNHLWKKRTGWKWFHYNRTNPPSLKSYVFCWVFNDVVCDGEEEPVMLLLSEPKRTLYDRAVERELLTNLCPTAVFFFLFPASQKRGEIIIWLVFWLHFQSKRSNMHQLRSFTMVKRQNPARFTAIARDENGARRCVFTMTTDGGFWCSLRVKFTETEIKHISRSFRGMWQCVKLYSLLKMSVYPFFFFLK